MVHAESYSKLGETYGGLTDKWFPASGRKPGLPASIEKYLNNPQMVAEAQLRANTGVRLP